MFLNRAALNRQRVRSFFCHLILESRFNLQTKERLRNEIALRQDLETIYVAWFHRFTEPAVIQFLLFLFLCCSLACAHVHLTVVEVLLQQGADPFHKLKVSLA